MGYNTRYHLTWEDEQNPTMKAVAREMAEIEGRTRPDTPEHAREAAYWAGVLEGDDEATWYDHETHMAEISRRFPGAIFVLHGNGDEEYDIWQKYFRNGLVQVAEASIVYPAFDEARLKQPGGSQPLPLNSPISALPTLEDVLQGALDEIVERVRETEFGGSGEPGRGDATAAPPATAPSPAVSVAAALGRAPELSWIVTDAYREAGLDERIRAEVRDNHLPDYVRYVLGALGAEDAEGLKALAREHLAALQQELGGRE